MLDRAQKNEQIEFLTNTVVDDVLDVGKKEVTGLRLRNLKTGEQWDLPTSAMFLGIGHTPNAGFVGDQLARDGDGSWFPKATFLEGTHVFVERDVANQHYRQADRCRHRLPSPRWRRRSSWKEIGKSGVDCDCMRNRRASGAVRWHLDGYRSGDRRRGGDSSSRLLAGYSHAAKTHRSKPRDAPVASAFESMTNTSRQDIRFRQVLNGPSHSLFKIPRPRRQRTTRCRKTHTDSGQRQDNARRHGGRQRFAVKSHAGKSVHEEDHV